MISSLMITRLAKVLPCDSSRTIELGRNAALEREHRDPSIQVPTRMSIAADLWVGQCARHGAGQAKFAVITLGKRFYPSHRTKFPVLIARYPLRVSPDSNISGPISPSCLTFSQPRRDEVSSLRDTKQHVKSHIRDIDMPDHRPDSSISSGIPSTFWSDYPSRPPHSLLVRQPTRRPSARPAAEFASPPRDMETNAYRRLVEAKDIRDTELC